MIINRNTPDGLRELLDTMERLGYYKYVGSTLVATLKHEALTTGYIFGWEETLRDYHADAEDLGEGGIEDFSIKLFRF